MNGNYFLHRLLTVSCLSLAGYHTLAQTSSPRQAPSTYAASGIVNYIRSWDAKAPESNPAILVTRALKDVKQTTQYFDGLGRPLQTVVKDGSLETISDTRKDIISAVEYDAIGREPFKYAAFVSTTSNGLFKLDAFQQQASFMNAQFGSQNETFFYGQSVFEPSPLNRVTETYAAGNSWAGTAWKTLEDDRHGVKVKYRVNTLPDDVRKWTVANVANNWGNYTMSGIYASGELIKTVTVNEHGKQVVEFKDKQGKIVLKKVQLTNAADNGTGSGYTGWLCTYYIYDDLNNLRCVIQPEGVNATIPSWTLSSVVLSDQCFRYEYDDRNRMIRKKIPGAGEVWTIYDARDRVVMTQDGNLRSVLQKKWMYTIYDELNRPIATGLLTDNTNYNNLVFHLNAAYNLSTYPNLSSYPTEELTRTFYDNYNWRSSWGNPLTATYNTGYDTYFQPVSNVNWPYGQSNTQLTQLKGKVTGSRINVLGTTTYLFNIPFYDSKGRVIQVQSQNLTGGTDLLTTQYNWASQPLVTISKQEKAATNPQTHVVVTRMDYDDLGRLLTTRKIVNSIINSVAVNKPEQVIVKNEYDALGQLKNKKLAPAYNGNAGLQTQAYDYNIRGWLLGMNRSNLSVNGASTNFFGFELGYDKLTNTAARNYLAMQYNGNITGMLWKSNGDGIRRKYDFAYDAANRLLRGAFEQNDLGTAWGNTVMNYTIQMGTGTDPLTAYDANGNIKAMTQYGWRLGVAASIPVDNLRYTYPANNSSNKLKSVKDFNNDALTKLGDFKTNTTHPQSATKAALTTSSTQAAFEAIVDYDYDANGNLKLDNNKAISSINYNHLNLPMVISVVGKGTITYTYDAAGNKLAKTVAETGQPAKTTIYLGGAVYENDVLQFIAHEEGRIRFRPAVGAIAAGFEYDYMIKDHLGNVRMLLTEQSQLDIYPVATLEGPIPNATTTATSLAFKEKDFYTIDNNFIVTNPAGINTSPNAAYQNNNLGTNNNPNCTGTLCTTTLSANVYRLNANTNKTGLGITLKVMAGDKVNVSGKSYHKLAAGTTYTLPVALLGLVDILNAFTGSGIMSPKGITGTQLNSYNTNPPNPSSFFIGRPAQSSLLPQAFINYILFDEQFKYAGSGFVRVGSSGVLTSHTIPNIPVTKNGYIFVYCSNESKYDVFFDNLHVTHNRGQILDETHYYPFGLTMAGISSKALSFGSPENKMKFNYGTELSSREFSDGSGLELYETPFRSYDAQIGRFHQIDPLSSTSEDWSPYAFVLDNPILRCDPLGLKDTIVNGERGETKQLENVTVKSAPKLKGGAFNGIAFSDIKESSNYLGGIIKGRLTNDKALEKLVQESADAKKIDKAFKAVGAFGGALTSLKYVTIKDVAKGKFKPTPLMIMATYIAVYGMKNGDYGDDLQKIVNDYILLHKDDPGNQQGVYSIENIQSYPALWNNGLKTVITVSYYDISTKKFIGDAVIR